MICFQVNTFVHNMYSDERKSSSEPYLKLNEILIYKVGKCIEIKENCEYFFYYSLAVLRQQQQLTGSDNLFSETTWRQQYRPELHSSKTKNFSRDHRRPPATKSF